MFRKCNQILVILSVKKKKPNKTTNSLKISLSPPKEDQKGISASINKRTIKSLTDCFSG